MSQLSVDFDNNLQRSVTFIYLKGKDYSLLLRGLYFFKNLLFGSNLWYKSIGVTRIFYYCEIFYYSEVYYCEVPLYLKIRASEICTVESRISKLPNSKKSQNSKKFW